MSATSTQNLCNEFSMLMLNAGWSRADITKVGRFYQVSGRDLHGREHGGARDSIESLIQYLLEIGALEPRAPGSPTPSRVSDGLAALLSENESLADGKRRLLVEYDVLTQRLHDERYEMSRAETGRHESISAILLELRS